MSKAKKHHYVPRWYLDEFTNSAGFLFVYDKQKCSWRKQRPREVMFITRYYHQPWAPKGVDPDIMEQTLGRNIEPAAKRAFRKLVSTPRDMTADDTAAALVHLEIQRLRVPRQAVIARQVFEVATLKHSPPKLVKAILTGRVKLIIKDSFRTEFMHTLTGELHPWFSRMEWEIIEASPETSFVTTDSPVSFYNVDFPPPNEAGLGLAGTIVLFPLDSRHLLVLRHPECTADNHTGPSTQLSSPQLVDGNIEVTFGNRWDAEKVTLHNSLMVHLSHRTIVADNVVTLKQCIERVLQEGH